MSKVPHYVRDYEDHVAHLLAHHPRDKAMELAVGGGFDAIGACEAEILELAGLKNGHSLLDVGCGSGRLAVQLARRFTQIDYLGTDIVQALLDYASEHSSPNYRFALNYELTTTATDSSLDFVCAFSVFTHLFVQESYIYLQDIRRSLRPGGRVVFSFLEIGNGIHWRSFENAVATRRRNNAGPMTMFIERPVIETWAQKLNFRIAEIYHGHKLGQSVAILQRPN